MRIVNFLEFLLLLLLRLTRLFFSALMPLELLVLGLLSIQHDFLEVVVMLIIEVLDSLHVDLYGHSVTVFHVFHLGLIVLNLSTHI